MPGHRSHVKGSATRVRARGAWALTTTKTAIPAHELERIRSAAHKAMIAVGDSLSGSGLHCAVDDNMAPVALPRAYHDPDHDIRLLSALVIGRASRFDFGMDIPSVSVCELIDRRTGAHSQVGLLASPGTNLHAGLKLLPHNQWYGLEATLPTDSDVAAFVEEHALRLARALLSIAQPLGK